MHGLPLDEDGGLHVEGVVGITDQRAMRLGLYEQEKVHRTSDPLQGRQPEHHVTASRLRRHQSMRELWQHIRGLFHRAESRCQFLEKGST